MFPKFLNWYPIPKPRNHKNWIFQVIINSFLKINSKYKTSIWTRMQLRSTTQLSWEVNRLPFKKEFLKAILLTFPDHLPQVAEELTFCPSSEEIKREEKSDLVKFTRDRAWNLNGKLPVDQNKPLYPTPEIRVQYS